MTTIAEYIEKMTYGFDSIAEPRLLGWALRFPLSVDTEANAVSLQSNLCRPLGIRPSSAWIGVNLPTFSGAPKRPGDLDLVVGELLAGQPVFGRLAGYEAARVKLNPGHPLEMRDERKADQLGGLVEMGMDFTSLFCLVPQPASTLHLQGFQRWLANTPRVDASPLVGAVSGLPDRRIGMLTSVMSVIGGADGDPALRGTAPRVEWLQPAVALNNQSSERGRALRKHLAGLFADALSARRGARALQPPLLLFRCTEKECAALALGDTHSSIVWPRPGDMLCRAHSTNPRV